MTGPELAKKSPLTTTATTTPAIELKGVTKRFGPRAVLDDVSLAIERGRTTVILGPSGTGKSTLLRLATGLLAPEAGTVSTLGVDVFCRPQGKAREASKTELLRLRRRMGMLFQDNALFGSLSVFDNVAFPLRRVQRTAEPEVRRRVDELLQLVGLPELGDRLPDRLSGGQRKRVALARAMALSPELVLFDEPTSGLDPQTSASIDQLIRDTQTRLGLTFVVITHDIESARIIADDAGLLLDGKVHIFGPRADVWASKDPRVRAFLDRAVAS
ncbi:MAG: ATP-binding cassette domain-containing protein [Deltaproteobacteria bacterium]|nr:ATP-binding cassette domain-containing protein [Deltaproteobacteria bacterium]